LNFQHFYIILEAVIVNEAFTIIAAITSSYLIGSFPTAYLMARLIKRVDIREIGTRNMGAMNVFYKIGFAEGLLVLAIDIGKGALAVFLARFLLAPEPAQLACGVMVVIGHAYPVFLRFRGGKGGAAAIGVLVFLMPWAIPVFLGIFLLLLATTRTPTLSYSFAFLCFPFIAWLIYHSGALLIFSLLLPLVPLVKYIPRIKEMRSRAGSWRRVFLRRSLKDRF